MSVRVRPEIRAALEAAADERVIGLALLVDRLLSEGLQRLVPVEELTGADLVEVRAAVRAGLLAERPVPFVSTAAVELVEKVAKHPAAAGGSGG